MCKVNYVLKPPKCTYLVFFNGMLIPGVAFTKDSHLSAQLNTQLEPWVFVFFAISDLFIGACGVTCQLEVPGMLTAKYLGKDISWKKKQTYTSWQGDTSRVTEELHTGNSNLCTSFLSLWSYNCSSGKGYWVRIFTFFTCEATCRWIRSHFPLRFTVTHDDHTYHTFIYVQWRVDQQSGHSYWLSTTIW